jgi:hypothetical protein
MTKTAKNLVNNATSRPSISIWVLFAFAAILSINSIIPANDGIAIVIVSMVLISQFIFLLISLAKKSEKPHPAGIILFMLCLLFLINAAHDLMSINLNYSDICNVMKKCESNKCKEINIGSGIKATSSRALDAINRLTITSGIISTYFHYKVDSNNLYKVWYSEVLTINGIKNHSTIRCDRDQ